MKVYLYRNFVSSDRDTLEEKIFEDIACDVKNIATVESMTESASEDIEEVIVNPQAIFRYMKNGYVFIEHIGSSC